MQHVAYGLRFNDTLKTLKFKGNAIRTDGAEYLGEALACNHTLTALSLAVRTRIKLHDATAKALLHSFTHSLIHSLIHSFVGLGSPGGIIEQSLDQCRNAGSHSWIGGQFISEIIEPLCRFSTHPHAHTPHNENSPHCLIEMDVIDCRQQASLMKAWDTLPRH